MKRMKVNNINLTKDSGYGFASKEDAQNALVKYYKNVFGYDVLSDITSDDGLGTAQAIRDLVAENGSSNKCVIQNSMRWYQYAGKFVSPSISYGANHYYWTQQWTSIPTTFNDTFHPVMTIPFDGKIIGYELRGTNSSTANLTLDLRKGTPTYGSGSIDFPLVAVGTTQSDYWQSGKYQVSGESGLDVDVKAGDVIIPFLKSDSNSTIYNKGTFTLILS
jgi:hypothetical protein